MATHDESHAARGGLPHLVCSCIHCQEVIGLPKDYATGDAMVCPVCEKPLTAQEVIPRTLRMAFHSEVTDPLVAPEPSTPELPTSDNLRELLERSAALGMSDSVLDPNPTDRQQDGDAAMESSLSGIELGKLFPEQGLAGTSEPQISVNEQPEAQEPQPEEETQKKTLSDTLGWGQPAESQPTSLEPTSLQPSAFEPTAFQPTDPPIDPPTGSSSAAEPAVSQPSPKPKAEPVAWEGASFDQLGSQLATPFEAEPEQNFQAQESLSEPEQGSLFADPSEFTEHTEPRGRSHLMPLAMAALLLVGGPLGYYGYSLMNSSSPSGADSSLLANENSTDIDEQMPEAPAFDNDQSSSFVGNDQETPPGKSRGVERASFEETISPNDNYKRSESEPKQLGNVVGDRYQQYANSSPKEPNPFDLLDQGQEPVKEKQPENLKEEAPVEVMLVDVPSYGLEELELALEQAASSGQAFSQGSFDTPEAVTESSRHYARLCYLAQVVTLLDLSQKSSQLLLAELDAYDQFQQAWSSEASRSRASQVASRWLSWEERPQGGVFFVGLPQLVGHQDGLHEYQCQLAEQQVALLSRTPIEAASNVGPLGIVGVIIENPAVQLPNYAGPASRVVWVRKTFDLPVAIDR